MKNIFSYALFVILLSFILVINVNAECSYQERKELLNEAKAVEAYFEPDLENNKFNFYLYNLTDNIYVKLENLKTNQSIEIHNYDLEDNYYIYVEDNISEKVTYRLSIYSNKVECYANKLTSKNIYKGIINKFYSENVCKGAEEYIYCQPFLENEITISDSEVIDKINEYKESLKIVEKQEVVESNFLFDFIKNYWKYILVFVITSIVISVGVLTVKKRKGELK